MKKSITSILSVGLVVLFSGCQQNVDTPSKPKIDGNLPMIEQSSIRHISDMNAVALEWKKIDIANAAGYYIIRTDREENGKFKRIATIDNKYVTHYLDTDLEIHTQYGYKISLMTTKGFESRASETIMVTTLPRYESVSLIESTSNLPRQIKILWRPHQSKRVEKYIIERTSPSNTQWKKIATVKNRLNVEYIDKNLGDNESYMYRIKTVTFDGIVSNYSTVTRAKTKSLPNHITQLNATSSLPKEIQLSWQNSDTPDVEYYNIYRSSSAAGSYSKLTKAPVSHNRFDDTITDDGKIYFYKITSVDKDGLESKLTEVTPIMGSTLAKPKVPQITLAMIEGDKMVLNWVSQDNRALSYTIYKTSKESWSSSKEVIIPNVQGLRFEDPNVTRGVEYDYRVQAIDKNGLSSEMTDKSTLKLPIIFVNGKKQ